MVYIYHIFFIHLSVSGHIGCFHVLAIVNSAAVNIGVHFTIVRTGKQPKWPSTDEWIKKLWHIYTMEYYSAIKRNEIGSFVETWTDLETVIQSEVSQKEKKQISYINAYIWNLEKWYR